MARPGPSAPLTERDWESAVKLAEKLAAAADLDPTQPAAAAQIRELQHLEGEMMLRLSGGAEMTAASWTKVIKKKVGELRVCLSAAPNQCAAQHALSARWPAWCMHCMTCCIQCSLEAAEALTRRLSFTCANLRGSQPVACASRRFDATLSQRLHFA